MRVHPYLFFNGNCKEAFTFYQSILGGKITAMMPHAGTPAEDSVPAEWRDKIIHACLEVGEDSIMASDAPPAHREDMKGFKVSLHFDEPQEAERVFKGLSDGGRIDMPIAETFWAKRFGMLADKFGAQWMINCSKPSP